MEPARRAQMGAAARDAVLRDFSWQRAVDATIEVYREVLSPSCNPHPAA
jgi:glycosyltransferase involved in cell wall biosynthesis